MPDIMALKNGIVKFIEVKTEKGKLSEVQKYRIKQLEDAGFEAIVHYGTEV